MGKVCVNHSSQPAVTMCHQCHKPICKSCTMVTPHGSFCSSECSVINREFKSKMKAGQPKKGSAGKVVVLLVLLAILVIGGIHMAAKMGGVEAAKRFDLIGTMLGDYKEEE